MNTPYINGAIRQLKIVIFPISSGFRSRTVKAQVRARLQILLLIHALATFLLWLVGKLADSRKLRPAYESNSRKDRPTISLLTLGAMVYAEWALALTETSALGLLQHHRALPDSLNGGDKFVGKPQCLTPFFLRRQ